MTVVPALCCGVWSITQPCQHSSSASPSSSHLASLAPCRSCLPAAVSSSWPSQLPGFTWRDVLISKCDVTGGHCPAMAFSGLESFPSCCWASCLKMLEIAHSVCFSRASRSFCYLWLGREGNEGHFELHLIREHFPTYSVATCCPPSHPWLADSASKGSIPVTCWASPVLLLHPSPTYRSTTNAATQLSSSRAATTPTD